MLFHVTHVKIKNKSQNVYDLNLLNAVDVMFIVSSGLLI